MLAFAGAALARLEASAKPMMGYGPIPSVETGNAKLRVAPTDPLS